ncbi:DUF565 domain-containing protein [Aerosakkonemataceae cyanobacterium BLCC-F50]|uniref:DUF565 domain-containing protein n=1 Tax=Floridaenema flaviceps BLCC-F50 TaxID=3153642 RepID=A0ABV4Y4L8_9CYAN
MQNTRLNTLVVSTSNQLGAWFGNPWRRLSLQLICLLLGFFLGTAVSTETGQSAQWDVPAAGVLVIFTELYSRFFYTTRKPGVQRSLLAESINLLKVGLTFSLFIEAFKLGS